MKHIYRRDKLKLVEDIFKNCNKAFLIDAGMDYVYTKLMVWYNDCKIPLEKKQAFEQLIIYHLPQEKGVEIMRTIADSYIEEGINKGIAIGEARGVEKEKHLIANKMLESNTEIKFISSVTGLSADEILKIKNKM